MSRTDKIVHRKKKYRDERGRIVFEGRQEAYALKHPRDIKKTPPQGAELANMNCWREACLRAAQIFHAGQTEEPNSTQLSVSQMNKDPDYYTPEEARELYLLFKERFLAQLPGKRGTHPDPEAPIDKLTGYGKRYPQFPNFIRAILYHNLKSL